MYCNKYYRKKLHVADVRIWLYTNSSRISHEDVLEDIAYELYTDYLANYNWEVSQVGYEKEELSETEHKGLLNIIVYYLVSNPLGEDIRGRKKI